MSAVEGLRVPPRRSRRPDWPERLAELVEARRAAPFAWGMNDCCLFAADAAVATTGADPAATLRGAYRREREAEVILARFGGLEACAAEFLARFGAGSCPPALTRRGDLALVLVGNQPTMGVVLGTEVAAPGPDGLVFLRLADATLRAWSL